MAPPQSDQKPSSNRRKEKPPPTLFVKTKYLNNLPPPPFDCKFVKCPFVDLKRFVAYKPTSLETHWKREILTEPDLGVKVDLIDPETYKSCDPDNMPEMHPTDRYLLEDEVVNTASLKRSTQHRKVVPWMRKTEYIASESKRYGKDSNRQETSVAYNLKKKMAEEGEDSQMPQDALRTPEAQIAAIQRTFELAKKSSIGRKHPTKKGVTAVEELPFYPDFDLWRNPFAQVTFDADPRPPNTSDLMVREKMCSALIRGMQDETGQFVAYFVPTDQTLGRRALRRADTADDGEAEEEGEEKDEYVLLRNYTWTVENKEQKNYEQAFVVSMRDGNSYYNEIETKVKLSRRRVQGVPQAIAKARMYLSRSDFTDGEKEVREARMSALRPSHEVEGEEEAVAQTADDSAAIVAPGDDASSSDDDDNKEDKANASEESDKDSSDDAEKPKATNASDESDKETTDEESD